MSLCTGGAACSVAVCIRNQEAGRAGGERGERGGGERVDVIPQVNLCPSARHFSPVCVAQFYLLSPSPSLSFPFSFSFSFLFSFSLSFSLLQEYVSLQQQGEDGSGSSDVAAKLIREGLLRVDRRRDKRLAQLVGPAPRTVCTVVVFAWCHRFPAGQWKGRGSLSTVLCRVD